MKVTKRQKEILDFIKDFIDREGYSPSMEEIAAHFHFASLNAVFKHLEALRLRGYLHREPNRARSIELAENSAAIRALPLLGRVAAGKPIEAISTPETLPVPEGLLPGRGDYYSLRVQGDSMIEEHIEDGDYVIVKAGDQAVNGEMVVALVDQESVTLKRFFREGALVRLQPANQTISPIILPAESVKLQGVVVGLIRKYR